MQHHSGTILAESAVTVSVRQKFCMPNNQAGPPALNFFLSMTQVIFHPNKIIPVDEASKMP